MNRIWKMFLMIKIISTIFFSFCFAGNPVYEWIESQSDILSREIKDKSAYSVVKVDERINDKLIKEIRA